MEKTKKDLYEVLGVPSTATLEEIKSRFRELALKLHPDKSRSPDTEAKFREISDAYEVLCDPIKRKSYDKEFESTKQFAKTNKNESVRTVWWRQLKTMGRELLRLLQNYSASMDAKQEPSSISKTRRNRVFEFEDEEVDEYFEESHYKPKKQKRKKSQNYEDPWIQSFRDDTNLVNDMFGFETSGRRRKRRRNDDFGFNMEDVFDI